METLVYTFSFFILFAVTIPVFAKKKELLKTAVNVKAISCLQPALGYLQMLTPFPKRLHAPFVKPDSSRLGDRRRQKTGSSRAGFVCYQNSGCNAIKITSKRLEIPFNPSTMCICIYSCNFQGSHRDLPRSSCLGLRSASAASTLVCIRNRRGAWESTAFWALPEESNPEGLEGSGSDLQRRKQRGRGEEGHVGCGK